MTGLTRRAAFLALYATAAMLPFSKKALALPDCEEDVEFGEWTIGADLSVSGAFAYAYRNVPEIRILDSNITYSEVVLELVRTELPGGIGYSTSMRFSKLALSGKIIEKGTTRSLSLEGKIGQEKRLGTAESNDPTDFIFGSNFFTEADQGDDLVARLTIDGIPAIEIMVPAGDAAAVVQATEALIAKLENNEAAGDCEPTDCFLTGATCGQLGLADDCFELSALRRLRDTVLAATPEGRAEIVAYYALAPRVMSEVAPGWTRRDWARLYATLVLPCAVLAWLGLHRAALKRYRLFVGQLQAQLPIRAG